MYRFHAFSYTYPRNAALTLQALKISRTFLIANAHAQEVVKQNKVTHVNFCNQNIIKILTDYRSFDKKCCLAKKCFIF